MASNDDASLLRKADYTLVERLGRGASCQVWKALAPGDIPVAVKVIRRDLTDEQAQAQRDALELTKKLRHAYLLHPQAFWAVDDRLFIAMELVDGSLHDRLRECVTPGQPGGIPVEELLPYVEQAAEAIDHLHDSHLLHRDIKPKNILRLGKVAKVADFGLAMVLPEDAPSVKGPTVGTIAYMGPEVWRGEFCAASDQWSLAVSYVELRLNRVLFDGGDPLAVAENEPDLTGLFDDEQLVLRQALDKDHDKRFVSCSEFAAALKEALAPVLPKRPSGTHSGVRPRVDPAQVAPRPHVPPGPPAAVAPSTIEMESVAPGLETLHGNGNPPQAAPSRTRPGVAQGPSAGPALALWVAAAGVVGAAGLIGGAAWLIGSEGGSEATRPETPVAKAPTWVDIGPAVPPAPGRPPVDPWWRDFPAPGAVPNLSACGEWLGRLRTASWTGGDVAEREARVGDFLAGVADRLDALPPERAPTATRVVTELEAANLPPLLSPYVEYARAVELEKKGEKSAAADQFVKTFARALPDGLKGAVRQKRIATLLSEAAHGLRRQDWEKPFGSDEADAVRALTWLTAARARLDAARIDLPYALRRDLALAAWYGGKKETDRAQVVPLTDDLLPPRDPKAMGPVDRAALWLARARALDQLSRRGPAYDAYREARKAVDGLPGNPNDESYRREVALVIALLEPATALGKPLARDGARAKVPFAELCAEEADLIRSHRSAPWPWAKDALPRKVFELYNQAVLNDPSRPEYYAWRGTARIDLPPTDRDGGLDLIRTDANSATARNENYARGWYLSGYANHLEARQQVKLERRLEFLNKAVDDYKKALDLPRDDSRPVLLTNRSAAFLELGNFTVNPRGRADYLDRARKDAEDAGHDHPRPEEAAQALGNAREDIAWLLEKDVRKKQDRYRQAVEAFSQALANQSDVPAFWLDRARVRARWVKDGKGDPDDLLPRAWADLETVLGLKSATALDRAKAHDGFAWIALLEGKADVAARQFGEAARLIDPDSKEAVVYAFDWVSAVRGEVAGGKNVPLLARAVRERVRRISADTAAWRAARALALGWSHEAENQPQLALKEYDTALGGDQDRAPPDDLPVILARGRLRLASRMALTPTQDACQDAEWAVKLAGDPEASVATRVEANAFAGEAWDARAGADFGAGDARARERGIAATQRSVDGFEEAVRLLPPDDRRGMVWRYRAACGLETLARVPGLDKKEKRAKVRAARAHLKKATAMTAPEDAPYRAKFEEELGKLKKDFPDCPDD